MQNRPTRIRFLNLLIPLFVLSCIPVGASAESAPETDGTDSEGDCSLMCTPPESLDPEALEKVDRIILEMELIRLKRRGDRKMRRMFNLIEAGCGQWEVWCEYV